MNRISKLGLVLFTLGAGSLYIASNERDTLMSSYLEKSEKPIFTAHEAREFANRNMDPYLPVWRWGATIIGGALYAAGKDNRRSRGERSGLRD